MASHNSFAKINLSNLKYNYNKIKELSQGKRIISIVKADSYGAGSVACMKALAEEGCDFFAVANLNEALEIREENKICDILVLGFVDINDINIAIENNISMGLYSIGFARAADKVSKDMGKSAKLHIKINTGMNRLGFSVKNINETAKALAELKNVEYKGIFSHFSTADEKDLNYTHKQYDKFLTALNAVRAVGINPEFIHIQNSAGICISDKMDFGETNTVRPGIILYGMDPSSEVTGFDFKPVMSFYAKVANIFNLDEEDAVSYGRKYIAKEKRRAAVVTAGYADGYHRTLSNKAEVSINGHRCKILGNVCMDMMIVDITGYDDIRIGDIAELFGENITADELATLAGTINYELLCAVSKRVEREYVK